MKRATCAFTLMLACLPALAQTVADPAPPVAPDAAPAQVVVEGRRPGPGVWKVSKGEHVMWVFGLYAPLPRKMEWDDARVERLVRNAQEVLLPPGVNIHAGFFQSLTLMPSMIGIEKNPDGATLQQTLPADVYARWQALKGKYMGEDDAVERKRPLFASQALLSAALKKNGLADADADVRARIVAIAKRNKVRVTDPALIVEVAEPRKMLASFKRSRIEDEACFRKTLDGLEGTLDTMRVRANAWANGDIAAIEAADYGAAEAACNNALMGSTAFGDAPELRSLPERQRAAWLKAAEAGLASNGATFALLHMNMIVGPQSYLDMLRERGYTVERPK